MKPGFSKATAQIEPVQSCFDGLFVKPRDIFSIQGRLSDKKTLRLAKGAMFGILKRRQRHDVNLWIIPLKMSIGALLLFALTMIPDTLAAYKIIHIPDWITMGGIDDARAILSAMMGCVSTVLALIFSVALLVLSMVATLFGPRLLYRFVQDWVTQATIGMFMAAFIYVFLVFLVTHQDANSTFIPQVSLLTCWLLVLLSFSFLVYYSHRIAFSIQNPDAVARITDDLRKALSASAQQSPNPERRDSVSQDLIDLQIKEGALLKSTASGYLQEIERGVFVEEATKANATIHFLFRPGQFVLTGEAIAIIWPKAQVDSFQKLIEKHVRVGRHRVLDQDVEFGIAQIVEIAIRALSPAVNDTFTGVACVDWLGESLVALGEKPQSGFWYDSQGQLRLREREVKVARLIKFAFDQIRQASADNPAVLIRVLSVIERVAPRLQNSDEQTALKDQATAVLETAMSKNPIAMDRKDIETAWQKTQKVLTSVS